MATIEVLAPVRSRHGGRATFLLISAGIASAVGYGVASLGTAGSHNGAIVLRGDGIGSARFGQSQGTAITRLESVFGAPKSANPTNEAGNCTIDAALQWTGITAYFFHQHFVGYATASLNGLDRTIPNVTTPEGLRIGDTVIDAEKIFAGLMFLSAEQGGAWFVTGRSGKFDGQLTSPPIVTNPPDRIANIEAGFVGCPAVSP